MNRNDEFTQLKTELEQTPAELDFIAAKAMKRAKKNKQRSLFLKTPLVSFCSIAIAFVLLVNLFPAVALAMSNTLGLKSLIRTVAFNPSLKLAVEHDYYQEIGESQTKEDVTVTVDYMILDAGNISFFFHIDAPVEKGIYHFEFLDSDQKQLPVGTSYDTLYESGKLEVISIQFQKEYILPEEFFFHITVNKDDNFQEIRTAEIPALADSPYSTGDGEPNVSEAEAAGVDYDFTFALHPDAKFSGIVTTIPVKQWVTVKDQEIYFDTLDIYPTNMRLSVSCDAGNPSVIEALDVSLVDDKDTEYNSYNTLFITDDPDRQDGLQYLFFESCYFSDIRNLKLYINGIAFIDKNKLFGKIDYKNKTIENMPGHISVEEMNVKNNTLYLTLKEYTDNSLNHSSVIDPRYFDVNGGNYYLNSWSFTAASETGEPNIYYYTIPNYKDNFYKLRWNYKVKQVLEQAVVVVLK